MSYSSLGMGHARALRNRSQSACSHAIPLSNCRSSLRATACVTQAAQKMPVILTQGSGNIAVESGCVSCSLPALGKVQRYLLATDSDVPGEVLAEELARRLGPENCFKVSWLLPPLTAQPQLPRPLVAEDSRIYKDANDVLLGAGPDGVRACIAAAQPYPVAGLHRQVPACEAKCLLT